MKKISVKTFLPIVIFALMLVIIGLLYTRSNFYEHRADVLFLKYDSITSANIELKHTLKRIGNPDHKKAVSMKRVLDK